jgi:hypothetical protein
MAVAPPSAELIAAGIKAMVDMVSSPYDDIAVNGCASVAKLASSCGATALRMASSVSLLQALLTVLLGDQSLDTLTNAALALSVLTGEPVGQSRLVQCVLQGGVHPVTVLLEKCNMPAEEHDVEYRVLSLRQHAYVQPVVVTQFDGCVHMWGVLCVCARCVSEAGVAVGWARPPVCEPSLPSALCECVCVLYLSRSCAAPPPSPTCAGRPTTR